MNPLLDLLALALFLTLPAGLGAVTAGLALATRPGKALVERLTDAAYGPPHPPEETHAP